MTVVKWCLYLLMLLQMKVALPEQVIPLPLAGYDQTTPRVQSVRSPVSGDDVHLESWQHRVRLMQQDELDRSLHDRVFAGDHAVAVRRERMRSSLEMHLRADGSPRFLRAFKQPLEKNRKILRQRSVVRNAAVSSRSDVETARGFLQAYAPILRLDHPADELQQLDETVDSLGHHHIRYEQRYRDIPVWPSRLLVHTNAQGQVTSLSGNTIATPHSMAMKVKISPGVAQQKALAALKATGLPDGHAATDLVIYAPSDAPGVLAWRCPVDMGRERWWVMIDAGNGRELERISRTYHEAASGSGLDRDGNSSELNLWQAGGQYLMVDTSKPMYKGLGDPLSKGVQGVIAIRDAQNTPGTPFPAGLPPKSDWVSSASANSAWLPDAVSASHNLSLVYDYYLQRHGRNSVDGKGSSLTAYVRYGKRYDNAFWDTSQNSIFFGDKRAFSAALDVVGHELTHGVIAHSADLLYVRQSGAMSEAFADIFGEMVEAFAHEGVNDWINGKSLGGGFRNLKAPGLLKTSAGKPFPASMKDYVKTTLDSGGVHTNATIISHVFYLLAEGQVGAIGKDEASQIFYRALTVYLTPGSQFIDLRFACLQAAEDLFGADAAQIEQVGRAFDAAAISETILLSGSAGLSLPVVNTDDSLLFLAGGQDFSVPVRMDRELGDPDSGTPLQGIRVKFPFMSVSRDGGLIAFVSDSEDACTVPLRGGQLPNCLGMPGRVQNVVIAPDGKQMALVLKEASGQSNPGITLISLAGKGERKILKIMSNTVMDGFDRISLTRASAMSFSANGRYLLFDAERKAVSTTGKSSVSWCIFALDLTTGMTMDVITPIAGKDFINPHMSVINPSLMVYEMRDRSTQVSRIRLTDLASGVVSDVAAVPATAYPSLTGDDTAVVYGVPQPGNDGGYALWQQDLSNQTASLLVAGARSAWVYRRARTQTLTTMMSGKGSGRITSLGGEIDCGKRCSAVVATGSVVGLQALAAKGSVFFQWKGDCAGQGAECSLPVLGAVNTTAEFALLPRFTLTLQKQGAGKGTLLADPLSLSCTSKCSRSGLSADTTLTVRAKPATGHRLSSWGGDCSGIEGEVCQLAMDRARNISAVFVKQ